ncbi:hypothetical protein L596_021076 [Steinernema carpocapsae]|uniref:Uncharacterized protein n=1 Tax=Steinernema carpocapsae TaxID=34508 RepID=A0A4U5MVM5_STECR|nr:hypothetical protein L596_021076 [Steinernema carpocapsae]
MAFLDTSLWSKVGECHKGQRIYNGYLDLATVENQLHENRWLQKMNLHLSSIVELQQLIEIFKTKFWLTKNLDFTAECSFTLADIEALGFQETNLKAWPKTLVMKSYKNHKAIQIVEFEPWFEEVFILIRVSFVFPSFLRNMPSLSILYLASKSTYYIKCFLEVLRNDLYDFLKCGRNVNMVTTFIPTREK